MVEVQTVQGVLLSRLQMAQEVDLLSQVTPASVLALPGEVLVVALVAEIQGLVAEVTLAETTRTITVKATLVEKADHRSTVEQTNQTTSPVLALASLQLQGYKEKIDAN
jgi:hypothetical protein